MTPDSHFGTRNTRMRALLLSFSVTALLTLTAHAQTAPLTATCRDGTTWTGQTRRGACSGHHGVQAFGTTGAPAAATTGTTASVGAPAATTATTTPAAPTATRPSPPSGAVASPGGQPAVGSAGQVWVNTRSKVYHCPGDRYYGHTVQGTYMTEAAARAAGDRPSRGKACA